MKYVVFILNQGHQPAVIKKKLGISSGHLWKDLTIPKTLVTLVFLWLHQSPVDSLKIHQDVWCLMVFNGDLMGFNGIYGESNGIYPAW